MTAPHVLRNNASKATIEKLSKLRPHDFSIQNQGWGLTYQKCRFCERSVYEVEPRYVRSIGEHVQGLWKYGVRHYCCEESRKHFSRFFGLYKGRKP